MSVRWIYSAVGDKIPDFSNSSDYFALFGVPFVLVGFVELLGAFWFFGRIRRLYCAVTDKKFFVLDRETVHSFTPDELSRMRGKKSSLRPGLSEPSEYVSSDYPHGGKPRVSGITLAALLIGVITVPRFREVKEMLVKMRKSGRA